MQGRRLNSMPSWRRGQHARCVFERSVVQVLERALFILPISCYKIF
ncbi:hypothetical protein X975_03526, partial [Stegodyphus mimosarum]